MDEQDLWREAERPLKIGGSTWCATGGIASLWDKPRFQILLFKELSYILKCLFETLNCSAQLSVLPLKSQAPLQSPNGPLVCGQLQLQIHSAKCLPHISQFMHTHLTLPVIHNPDIAAELWRLAAEEKNEQPTPSSIWPDMVVNVL